MKNIYISFSNVIITTVYHKKQDHIDSNINSLIIDKQGSRNNFQDLSLLANCGYIMCTTIVYQSFLNTLV
jgi:hypothetical protein